MGDANYQTSLTHNYKHTQTNNNNNNNNNDEEREQRNKGGRGIEKSRTRMSVVTKGRVILVKHPNDTGTGEDRYDSEVGEGWRRIHVSILRTERDAGMVEELGELVKRGGVGEGLDGVVLTSGRAVSSLQLAIDRATDDSDGGSGGSGSGWASLPFFVVGQSTRNRLLALLPRAVFPDPHSLTILGHQHAGSGRKLAHCIIAHFSSLSSSRSRQPIRLLYLVGSHHDSSLADTLLAHNQQQHACQFELLTKQVYRIEAATEPQIFPNTEGMGEPSLVKKEDHLDTLRERVIRELESKRGVPSSPPRAGVKEEGDDWMVFFSPNSARILLSNTNDLLLKTIQNLPAPPLHLNLIHFAAIGPTTANFLSNLGFPPTCVAPSPSPNSLFHAISNSYPKSN
ncbi:uncharacterized protein VP01_230g7 [Puccinia sorghi]|uniref:Tetrapyrrole biosynthesis uroporphyrinogen III synthase domain-containing protein n=1 Tax=Puccinia sorghi TaxID=27349 RepID=A0A0L6V7W1_9BASI|nr:uncharacterized protein VP01_230g7 [Puccinia sorghi]